MKYYITKGDEMVGPLRKEEPHKPYNRFYSHNRYVEACEEWNQHLSSLPKIKHRLPNKVGDIVEEGKDFEWEYHCDNDLCACNIVGLNADDCPSVYMVAIPKGETKYLTNKKQ